MNKHSQVKTMKRSKTIFNQKFREKELTISLFFGEEDIVIRAEEASKALLTELMNEIVYDGYAEAGETDYGEIRLLSPDYGLCGPDELKDMIRAKLESLNYEVTFLS